MPSSSTAPAILSLPSVARGFEAEEDDEREEERGEREEENDEECDERAE